MKIRDRHRFTAKMITILLCGMGMLVLPGCTGNAGESAQPVQAPEKGTFLTCFGTVHWKESQVLSFPFDLPIRGIEVRNGQIVSPQEILFHIDYDELIAQKAGLENTLKSLQFMKSSYKNELALWENQEDDPESAEPDPYSVRSAQVDLESAQNKLEDLNAEYLALAAMYEKYPSLYSPLEMKTGLEAASVKLRDQELAVEKCRINLEKVQDSDDQTPDGEHARIQAQRDLKSAQILQTDAEILHAEKNADILKAIVAGQIYQNVKFIENGDVCITESGYLIDDIYAAPNRAVPANEPVMSLVSMDSLEVVCYAEEQLAKDIRVGDHAQLSLYSDSTAVALGAVAFISQKAIIVNGETVVEVVIDYDGADFLPGYNVVAKITPGKKD